MSGDMKRSYQMVEPDLGDILSEPVVETKKAETLVRFSAKKNLKNDRILAAE